MRTKKLDLILVNTPLFDYSKIKREKYASLAPLGLGYIATYLKHQGYTVFLLDSEHLCLTPNKIADFINKKKPRFVGLNLFTLNYNIVKIIISLIDSKIKIFIGGPHSNALPLQTFSDKYMDKANYLFIGDSEYKVEGILNNFRSSKEIPGLLYRHNGKIKMNEEDYSSSFYAVNNLDSLPIVDRDFFPTDPFYSERHFESSVMTSRGCYKNCSFCAGAKSVVARSLLKRSIGNIISEIELLNSIHNVTAVRFIDDIFLSSKKFSKDFITEFCRHNLHKKVVWHANADLKFLCKASDNELSDLKSAGCRGLTFGIESGSRRLLKYINKEVNIDDVRALIERLVRQKLRIYAYFMIGIPTEEMKETYQTIHLFHEARKIAISNATSVEKIHFRANIFEFHPFPGTIEWFRLLKNGYDANEMMSTYRPFIINGLDERVKYRWSNTIKYCELSPKKIQFLMKDALLTQKDEMEYLGVSPTYNWETTNKLSEISKL